MNTYLLGLFQKMFLGKTMVFVDDTFVGFKRDSFLDYSTKKTKYIELVIDHILFEFRFDLMDEKFDYHDDKNFLCTKITID